MEVICLEEEAFYKLIDKVIEHTDQKQSGPSDFWIDGDEAMRMLRIKSTTLQRLRDEGKISHDRGAITFNLRDATRLHDHLELASYEGLCGFRH